MATIHLEAKDTITPVLLNRGDTLQFMLRNSETRVMTLLDTDASIMRTNVEDLATEEALGASLCQFTCRVRIDGQEMTMQRYLPAQESFYEPYVINGLRIWFDAVQDYFRPFTLSHGRCQPRTHARFAVHDALDPVAPALQPWYLNDAWFIDVRDCYLGDDTWMGPYLGASPHGGLDINMDEGTPLYTPMDCDDQSLFRGFEYKPGYWAASWQAVHRWPDGARWHLYTAHLNRYLAPPHQPLTAGTPFAEAAGTGVGARPHSHFRLTIVDERPNRIDGQVQVAGDIVGETGDDNNAYLVDVEDVKTKIEKSATLYVQRAHRDELSLFSVPRRRAEAEGLAYNVPEILLDPWYIFWQVFENQRDREGRIRAQMAPLSPARTGEPVHFCGAGSHAGLDGGPLTYQWTFGDGTVSDAANPIHIYATPGIYAVTLTVDDGQERRQCTQQITVGGEAITSPVLALSADNLSFHRRAPYVMDIYGLPPRRMPHTLHFVARASRPRPKPKVVALVNLGGGALPSPAIRVVEDVDWLVVEMDEAAGRVLVAVDAIRRMPGRYRATVEVDCPGALNSPQRFWVTLEVRARPARHQVIVDCEDDAFQATPYFWVGGRWHRWTAGYNGFLLTNGGRAKAGERYRVTPDLAAGLYNVSFTAETPWSEDARCRVRVRHADGEETLWVQPGINRRIGRFGFKEGTDGFVEVYAEGSTGEILADAIQFLWANPTESK